MSPTGVISWTPGSGQADTTNNVAVRVYDDGIPPLSATNSFELIVTTGSPTPAPAIQSIVLSNGMVWLTWSAVSNRTYMLQKSDDILSTNWSDLPPAITATNGSATATDSATGDQRFYRVHLVP